MTITTLDDLLIHTLGTPPPAEHRRVCAWPQDRPATDPGPMPSLRRPRADAQVERPARLTARPPEARTLDAAAATLARLIAQYEIAHRHALVALTGQMGNPQAGALLQAQQPGARVPLAASSQVQRGGDSS